MPATTPGTLPYPLPADPVANGADAIKNLALAIDPALAIFTGPVADTGIAAAVWTTLGGPPPTLVRGMTYDPVTGVVTVQSPGLYRIDGTATFNAAAAGDRIMRVALNGTADPGNTLVTTIVASVATIVSLRASTVKQLAAGDTLRLQVFTTTAATLRGTSNNGWGSGMAAIRVAP
jgi:hypothetical protein